MSSNNNFHYNSRENNAPNTSEVPRRFSRGGHQSHYSGAQRNLYYENERSQSPRGGSRFPRSPSNQRQNVREYKRSRSRDRELAIEGARPLRTQDKPSGFTTRRSSSHESRKRICLDFKVFIKAKYIEQGLCTFTSLDQIVKSSGCDDILIDDNMAVPEQPGKILVIKSKSIDKKAEAFITLMRMMEDQETLIFVPHTLVSMVIGSKGRTINSIKKEAGCDILVNQQVPGLPLCSILIKSSSPRIQSSTCKNIFELLERTASVDDLKEVYVKPLSKSEINTVARFVISEDSQGYLIGKHGVFTKQLDDIGIYMHCGKEQHNKALRPREAICSLEGTLKDVEEATEMIVKRLASYYEASKKDYETVPLALLIPSNLVTKIIGAGGSLIQQLVQKTGAQIRVSCSKNDPYTEEVVVTIDGTLEQKQRGSLAVLSQVEFFKKGGPILQSDRHSGRELGGRPTKTRSYKDFERGNERDERNKGHENHRNNSRERGQEVKHSPPRHSREQKLNPEQVSTQQQQAPNRVSDQRLSSPSNRNQNNFTQIQQQAQTHLEIDNNATGRQKSKSYADNGVIESRARTTSKGEQAAVKDAAIASYSPTPDNSPIHQQRQQDKKNSQNMRMHGEHSAENSLLDEYAPNQDEDESFVELKDKQAQQSQISQEIRIIKNLEIKLPNGLTLTLDGKRRNINTQEISSNANQISQSGNSVFLTGTRQEVFSLFKGVLEEITQYQNNQSSGPTNISKQSSPK